MRFKNLIGTKDFYQKVLFIAMPIILQNGITNFVGLLDNIMVGQVGASMPIKRRYWATLHLAAQLLQAMALQPI